MDAKVRKQLLYEVAEVGVVHGTLYASTTSCIKFGAWKTPNFPR